VRSETNPTLRTRSRPLHSARGR